jgi:four helix bundle protein
LRGLDRRQYREGCGKDGNPEFHRYLQMASGSASELEYHFLLAKDLAMLNVAEHERLETMVAELRRMLASLIRRVVAKPKATS